MKVIGQNIICRALPEEAKEKSSLGVVFPDKLSQQGLKKLIVEVVSDEISKDRIKPGDTIISRMTSGIKFTEGTEDYVVMNIGEVLVII